MFKVEVIADNSGQWVGNQLTFDCREKAEEYAIDLMGRWTAVRDTRVVELFTLEDYSHQITRTKCRWCQVALPMNVDRYDHDGGWKVHGFERRQWLSIKCPKCGYDWSLNKLGVSTD